MSDVARYTAAGDGVVRLDDEGPLVVWQDYARLQAEVERLRAYNDEAMAHIAKEERKSRERLDIVQAEITRLRKAGDAMADWFTHNDCRECRNDCQGWLPESWNAAKDGKEQP